MSLLDNWKFIVLLCLTLGLAPFYPEPHLWGKIKWIAGGAHGMQAIDWWDTVQHGLPWLLLIVFLVRRFVLGLPKEKSTA